MSEVAHLPSARTGAAPASKSDDDQRWHDLVSQVGAEIAEPLTAALERINILVSTGKIDRAGLRALRESVETARQAGIIGQQLTRFATGRVRQSHEVLQLEEVLANVLSLRSRETQARGIVVTPRLSAARVIVDGSLLFSLLNASLDWALANAESEIDFGIDLKTWPVHARLSCRFAHRPADSADAIAATAPPRLDSLTWRLIEQTAWTMNLVVDRKDVDNVTTLVFEFPKTIDENATEAVASPEPEDAASVSGNSKALAGSHVLVIASRRELRVLIRDALRNMSMLVDFVSSVEEAASFCREGLPHAIVFEGIQKGTRFAHFRDEILAEVPEFVFIEILEQGSQFEMSGTGSAPRMARVGRDVIATSLPAALMFELSRSL